MSNREGLGHPSELNTELNSALRRSIQTPVNNNVSRLAAEIRTLRPRPLQMPATAGLPVQYPATYRNQVEQEGYTQYKANLLRTIPRRVVTQIPANLSNIAEHSADLHSAGLTSASYYALMYARNEFTARTTNAKFAEAFLNEFSPQVFNNRPATVDEIKRQAAAYDSKWAIDYYLNYLKLEAERYGTRSDIAVIALRDLNDPGAHVQLRALALKYFQIVLPQYLKYNVQAAIYAGGGLRHRRTRAMKKSRSRRFTS